MNSPPHALAHAGSCPVCGDVFGEAPHLCPHCGTPHHRDCWDYVPGCAVFGCSEETPPALVEWPWSHKVILTRARLMAFNANLIQAAAVCTMAGVNLSKTASAGLVTTVFMFILLIGLLSVSLGLITELIFRFSPARLVLEQADQQGDRRLRTAIERRTGSVIPIQSWKLSLILGISVFLPFFFRDLFQLIGSGNLLSSKLLVICLTTPLVGVLGGLFFFPMLWISEKLIGSQRILVHRLEASLTRGEEKKPTGAAPRSLPH